MKKNIHSVNMNRNYFNEGITLTSKSMARYFSKGGLFLITAIALIFITGCAQNEDVGACLTGHTYGFFGGLWHGFIAPFDFIGMLFNDEITLYAQNNNGGLYALGFLLGSGGWGFLGSKSAKRVRRSRVTYRDDRFDKAEVVE
jgi:hypothetical protein